MKPQNKFEQLIMKRLDEQEGDIKFLKEQLSKLVDIFDEEELPIFDPET